MGCAYATDRCSCTAGILSPEQSSSSTSSSSTNARACGAADSQCSTRCGGGGGRRRVALPCPNIPHSNPAPPLPRGGALQ